MKKLLEDNKTKFIKEKNELEIKLKEALNKNENTLSNLNNLKEKESEEIAKLRNELEQKNIKLKILEKTNANQKILNNRLSEYEDYNKKLEKSNKELNQKVKNLTEEKEKLIQEKNDLINNLNNNNNYNNTVNNTNVDNSYTLNKMYEMEEELESLKIKNKNILSELKDERNKNEEFLLKIEKLEKRNKNEYDIDNRNEDIMKDNEEIEEMKKKYEDALKDCDNYKMINEKLLRDNNEKQKIIDEYDNLINDNDKDNLKREIENLKDIITEKESDNKELIDTNIKLESELRKYRRKEKNPFNLGSPLSEEFRGQKLEDGRYSMGAKEARAERYKKMVMDYENQIGNDQSQLNMLKSDIKTLRNKLKEKEKDIKEMKQLIEAGYKGYNPSNKAQKEAVKKLKEFLDKE